MLRALAIPSANTVALKPSGSLRSASAGRVAAALADAESGVPPAWFRGGRSEELQAASARRVARQNERIGMASPVASG